MQELGKQLINTSTKINSKISLKSTVKEKVALKKTRSKIFEGDHPRQGMMSVKVMPKNRISPVTYGQKSKVKNHLNS